MWEEIERAFQVLDAGGDRIRLRAVRERVEALEVRRGVVQPPEFRDDWGAMVTAERSGGVGYAATPDLSPEGLLAALDEARLWAERSAASNLPPQPGGGGLYASPVDRAATDAPIRQRIDRLRAAADALRPDDRIVDWSAGLWCCDTDSLLLSSDGGRVEQRIHALLPTQRATAHASGVTQTRTLGGDAYARQAGLELLDELRFEEEAGRIAEEALELLAAPNCPSGRFDLVLAPDQMILQIHESIGHPLELDRILGDERNYAGTSFVRPEMFGSYRYGSELLNVSFDPDVPGQLGSYAFDDEGTPAQRALVIENGILMRPLGGARSQARAGMDGVANARATSWNRPPIDRMANLNVEPGASTFDELVCGIEDGFLLETNCSWSIDHERNKFQFGCERGRRIRKGALAEVVRNPNYRGRSAEFWRQLDGVGNRATWRVLGTPYCGKGEPNQLIRVGHAAPMCRFRAVDVFGGA